MRCVSGSAIVSAGAALVLLFGAPSAVTAQRSPHPNERPARAPTLVVGPNVRASDNATMGSGTRAEMWISASQTNANVLIGVSAHENPTEEPCVTTVSTDGGATWHEVRLPGSPDAHADHCADPMVAAGPDGRIYVVYHGLKMDPTTHLPMRPDQGVIRVWTTADDAKTWSGPVNIDAEFAPSPDHGRIAVDLTHGPHRGRVYVEWCGIWATAQNTFHIFLSYSDDGGATFTPAEVVATAADGKPVSTEPVILSDGTLLVSYYQYFLPNGHPRNDHQPFYLIRSEDGGATFGPPVKIAEIGPGAWPQWGLTSASGVPVITADASPRSPYRDHVYLVWYDVSAGTSDIWLSRSTDGGRTWLAKQRLNDNVPASDTAPLDFRNLPVVDVTTGGVVAVGWYDRRDDPSRRCWRYYMTVSQDGGAHFLPNTPVASASSCPARDIPPTVYLWNPLRRGDTLAVPPLMTALDCQRERDYCNYTLDSVGRAYAMQRASQNIRTPRIRVGFDPARNEWIGDYSGLTSDRAGVLHPLWADRRNGWLQLYTARVEVRDGPPPPPPPAHDTTVTGLVELMAGPAQFDEATGTSTFELRLHNVSSRTIVAPLRIEIAHVFGTPAGPSAVPIADSSLAHGRGGTWDFSSALGAAHQLLPGMVTEARSVTVRTSRETGLDGLMEFEVHGGVSTP